MFGRLSEINGVIVTLFWRRVLDMPYPLKERLWHIVGQISIGVLGKRGEFVLILEIFLSTWELLHDP